MDIVFVQKPYFQIVREARLACGFVLVIQQYFLIVEKGESEKPFRSGGSANYFHISPPLFVGFYYTIFVYV